MTRFSDGINDFRGPVLLPEDLNSSSLTKIQTDLFALILIQDPFFGEPVADRRTKRSMGGPILYKVRAVDHAAQFLKERSLPIDTNTLSQLLAQQYERARADYFHAVCKYNVERMQQLTEVLPVDAFTPEAVEEAMHESAQRQAI